MPMPWLRIDLPVCSAPERKAMRAAGAFIPAAAPAGKPRCTLSITEAFGTIPAAGTSFHKTAPGKAGGCFTGRQSSRVPYPQRAVSALPAICGRASAGRPKTDSLEFPYCRLPLCLIFFKPMSTLFFYFLCIFLESVPECSRFRYRAADDGNRSRSPADVRGAKSPGGGQTPTAAPTGPCRLRCFLLPRNKNILFLCPRPRRSRGSRTDGRKNSLRLFFIAPQ